MARIPKEVRDELNGRLPTMGNLSLTNSECFKLF